MILILPYCIFFGICFYLIASLISNRFVGPYRSIDQKLCVTIFTIVGVLVGGMAGCVIYQVIINHNIIDNNYQSYR
jgi:hypothetical protein